MTFRKEFTEEMVLSYLKATKYERTRKEIQEEIGCSKMTAVHLIKSMLDKGLIKQRSIGTPKKPAWLYSLAENAQEQA